MPGTNCIDTKKCGEAPLLDARLAVQDGEGAIFIQLKSCRLDDLGQDTQAELVKAKREERRNLMPRRYQAASPPFTSPPFTWPPFTWPGFSLPEFNG